MLQELGLGGNELSMTAGSLIGSALANNDTLVSVDLSWNQFRLMGAVHLLDGIRVSIHIGARIAHLVTGSELQSMTCAFDFHCLSLTPTRHGPPASFSLKTASKSMDQNTPQ